MLTGGILCREQDVALQSLPCMSTTEVISKRYNSNSGRNGH